MGPALFPVSRSSIRARICCALTVHFQPRHARSVDQSSTPRLHFQNVQRLRPVQIRFIQVPLLPFLRAEVREESTVDRYDVWREIVHHPTENLLRVVPEVPLRSLRFDQVVIRRPRNSEDRISHVHQWLVEPGLPSAHLFALACVQRAGFRKTFVELDLFNNWPPQLLPVFRDVQNGLHEDIYVDEDPMALEVLGDILFVLDRPVFLRFIGVGFQPRQDRRSAGRWG